MHVRTSILPGEPLGQPHCFWSDLPSLSLSGHLLRQSSLASCLASGEGAAEAVLGVDAVNAVARVEVLNNHHLEAGCGTLARSNGRVGQEQLPDLNCVSLYIGEERVHA